MRSQKSNTLEIQESFLGFLKIDGKDSKSIFSNLINFLHHNKIQLDDCIGQVYDNASNFSGRVNGVAKRFLEVNKKAIFINCINHNLNLILKNAAEVMKYQFFSS